VYKKAIVSKIDINFENGLSGKFGDLGKPDFQKALQQHESYVRTLIQCGLDVHILEADAEYPDSTFVEDVAIVTDHFAVLTNPEPASRKGEIARMEEVLKGYFSQIEHIEAPSTLEGGDVLQIEHTFYIGISERTSQNGALQLSKILDRYGYQSVLLPISQSFHLKGLVSDLGDHYITLAGELIDNPAFDHYHKIIVDPDEAYACNVLRINGNVLIPKGYEKTRRKIIDAGFRVIELEMSEFQKQDGSLTCLSLKF
jgi:dimethylargininase